MAYQNNLVNRFQTHNTQPIQYMNNQMLNNNPLYSSNIYDQNFYQRMMLQREEQMRKIKNVSDLNLSKEQITEYVIAPIKVVKGDTAEIKKLFDDEEQRLTKKFIEDNWWSQRTNAPYKNILKDQDWKKDFKKSKDLRIHKYSNLDKIGLMEEYETINKLLEQHDGELKVIFSSSKESEYKKSFKFVQKYRGRFKYNPKDYNELKGFYEKEQKKFDREQKRIDDVISRIMDDDIDDKELKQIESDFSKPSKKVKQRSNHKHRELELDRQIQELIDEYGEDLLKELDENSDDNNNKKSNKNKLQDSKDKLHNSKDRKNSNNDRKSTISKKANNEPKENRIRIKRTAKDVESDNKSTIKPSESESTDTKRIRIKRAGKNNDSDDNDSTSTSSKSNMSSKSNKPSNETETTNTSASTRRIKIVRKTQI